MLVASLVVVEVVLDDRLMIPGRKTHLKKTITITIDMVGGLKRVVLPLTMAIDSVDGVGGVVLAITMATTMATATATAMAITMTMTASMVMTMTMTMAMTMTMTMTIDVVGGMEGVVLDGQCTVARTGLDHLARIRRGRAHVLMAPHQAGC